jgi:hypothetical protein
MPAFSPLPPPLAPLAFAALSPPQPCSSPAPPLPAWRQWRGCGYWRADVRPANLKTIDADPSTLSTATTMRWRPQATSRRGSSPSDHHENNYFIRDRGYSCLNPNALSLVGHHNRFAIYSCQFGLIRETCLDSSSLIDWLWIWWMDFVALSLC